MAKEKIDSYVDSPRTKAQVEMADLMIREFRTSVLKINKEVIKEVRSNGNFNTKSSK